MIQKSDWKDSIGNAGRRRSWTYIFDNVWYVGMPKEPEFIYTKPSNNELKMHILESGAYGVEGRVTGDDESDTELYNDVIKLGKE